MLHKGCSPGADGLGPAVVAIRSADAFTGCGTFDVHGHHRLFGAPSGNQIHTASHIATAKNHHARSIGYPWSVGGHVLDHAAHIDLPMLHPQVVHRGSGSCSDKNKQIVLVVDDVGVGIEQNGVLHGRFDLFVGSWAV